MHRAVAILLLLGAAPAASAVPGALLIAGGALAPDNAAVWEAFLDQRPVDRPRILVLPAASGVPHEAARSAKAALMRHGACADDIMIVEIASVDDPATPDVDESRWSEAGDDARLAAAAREAGAFWFTGGDQVRILDLLTTDGADRPLLAAIRDAHARGAVVGGTSAGAAMMSNPMIAGGDPLRALMDPPGRARQPLEGDPAERLVLTRGLGFTAAGIVDQHFDARARLGRLVRAVAEAQAPAGFGVDEDTALLVERGGTAATVVGRGTVVVVDPRAGHAVGRGERFAVRGWRVHAASHGDRIDLAALTLSAAPGRRVIAASASPAPVDRGGYLAPAVRLEERLARFLAAPDTVRTHDMLSFEGTRGQVLRFARDASTDGFRGGEGAGLTLRAIGLSTGPVRLTLVPEPD